MTQANAPTVPKSPEKAPAPQPPAVQGEGDYEAARRHRESAESFVKSGKVEQAAHDAAPKTPEEGQSLLDAEKAGEQHSKGEDPALKHSPPRKD
jgi:hypothetical protein